MVSPWHARDQLKRGRERGREGEREAGRVERERARGREGESERERGEISDGAEVLCGVERGREIRRERER